MRSADPNDYAGKTVRLRDDGTIPPDNPFVSRPGYKPGIYTLGHRNGHSMPLNPRPARSGSPSRANGGDEINILKPGANYGWPYVSHGRNYKGPKISDRPCQEGTEQPSVVWVPSIAVTGGRSTRATCSPAGGGTCSSAACGKVRRRHRPPAAHRVQRQVGGDSPGADARELNQRIRDVRQGPDGLLYVATSGSNGSAILRIKAAPAP